MQQLLRFVVPAIAALAIMAGLLALSVWIVELPYFAERFEELAEDLTVASAEPDDVETAVTAPRPAALPTPNVPAVDCAAEAARIDRRVSSARACSSNLDCVISAPRQRCIVPLRVGIAGAIEDDLLRVSGLCAEPLNLPTLDALCRVPDRGWSPICSDGVCVLIDSFDVGQ
ncbi:MAG: hypothetical protein AAFX44_02815 [Pseudomonadota bacterium]